MLIGCGRELTRQRLAKGADVRPPAVRISLQTALQGAADLLDSAAAFRSARRGIQDAQLERMAEVLPLPQVHLPHLFTTGVDRGDLELLADALIEGIGALEAGAGA